MKQLFGEERLLKLLSHSIWAADYSYVPLDIKSFIYSAGNIYEEKISFVSDGLEFELDCSHEIENYCLVFHVYKRDENNRLKTIYGFIDYYSYSFLPDLSKGVEIFGLYASGSEFEGIKFFNSYNIEKYFLFDLWKVCG